MTTEPINVIRLPEDDEGYQRTAFQAPICWIRGAWRCEACGTVQMDLCTGGENVLTCLPCPNCNTVDAVFEVIELIGYINGEERDFKDSFLAAVLAERP